MRYLKIGKEDGDIDPLYNYLPKDQIERVMHSQMCDIDPEFLGFIDIYRSLAAIIPRHWTVVDLGCAYAAQAFLFVDHKSYIGVDLPASAFSSGEERFHARNTIHYRMTIADFCDKHIDDLDMDTTFAICSYVPPWHNDNIAIARKTFKNVFTYYPSGTRLSEDEE